MTTERNVLAVMDEYIDRLAKQRANNQYAKPGGATDRNLVAMREARAAVAELVEAHHSLIKAVRAFADGDMSVEVRDRLFLSKHDGPEQATFAALCEASDEAEAALAPFQTGGAK